MDVYQYFGEDLVPSNLGDLLTADGITLTQQRILRRLLTNPGGYIFHPTYGAGLPSYIGQLLTTQLYNLITGLIVQQMYLEQTVSQNPPPVIKITQNYGAFYYQISYTQLPAQTLQTLTFTVSP
jgi:hypothetical protein